MPIAVRNCGHIWGKKGFVTSSSLLRKKGLLPHAPVDSWCALVAGPLFIRRSVCPIVGERICIPQAMRLAAEREQRCVATEWEMRDTQISQQHAATYFDIWFARLLNSLRDRATSGLCTGRVRRPVSSGPTRTSAGANGFVGPARTLSLVWLWFLFRPRWAHAHDQTA